MKNKRKAFTLVELLVVIAIIGVLVATLLPAVQQARESARRIECANNIKQLALAVLNYEDTFKRLPPSGLVNINEADRYAGYQHQSGAQLSWIVVVMPFMELGPVYDQFDLQVSAFDQPLNPQETNIETLLCPSDSIRKATYVSQSKEFAKGNYAAWVSVTHTDSQMSTPGVISGKGKLLGELIDGTSNTMMLSEIRKRQNQSDQRGAWALAWPGSTQISFDMHPDSDRFYRPFTHWQNQTIIRQVQLPNNLGPNSDILFECPDPSGAKLEKMPCSDFSQARYLSVAPRSRHLAGVNSAFADGHVQFHSDQVDPVFFSYVLAIDDGVAISLSKVVD